MRTLFKNHNLPSLLLIFIGLSGLALISFYLVEVVHEPEYLFYFAPIFGLTFYGSYYIVNHKPESHFLNQAYSDTHADA